MLILKRVFCFKNIEKYYKVPKIAIKKGNLFGKIGTNRISIVSRSGRGINDKNWIVLPKIAQMVSLDFDSRKFQTFYFRINFDFS